MRTSRNMTRIHETLRSLAIFGLLMSAVGSEQKILFQDGMEYKYQMAITASTGSSDYIKAENIFKLEAILTIKRRDKLLHLRINQPRVNLVNGNTPVNANETNLKPLETPFRLELEDGKAKRIGIERPIPTWAENMQKGIASLIQIQTGTLSSNAPATYEIEENTLIGKCLTEYTVSPYYDGIIEVLKYRDHLKCSGTPQKIAGQELTAHFCPTSSSLNTWRSSGDGLYILQAESETPNVVYIENLNFKSKIFMNIFGNREGSHSQFSLTDLDLQFLNRVQKRESSKRNLRNFEYGELNYVFESENNTEMDENLEVPRSFYAHQVPIAMNETDNAMNEDRFLSNLKELHSSFKNLSLFNDTQRFHAIDPAKSLIPLFSMMTYDQIKRIYQTLQDEKDLKHLFLDMLSMSETGPAVRLILEVASDLTVGVPEAARLLLHTHSHVTNPSERILEKFEQALDPANHEDNTRFTMELCFATLLGRRHKKFQATEKLQKWLKTWTARLDDPDLQVRTFAALIIGNIRVKESRLVLLNALADPSTPTSVRSAIILTTKKDTDIFGITNEESSLWKDVLLKIFLNQTEDAELRNNAAEFLLINGNQIKEADEIFQLITVSQKSETCAQVKHFVWTLLKSLSETTHPCLLTFGSYARRALQNLVPMDVLVKNSAYYLTDYYDRRFDFGHAMKVSVQQDGLSVIPRTITASIEAQLAGYSSDFLTVHVRAEGVEKAFTALRKHRKNFRIEEILEQLGITPRNTPDMSAEVIVFYQGRAVIFMSYNKQSVDSLLLEIPNGRSVLEKIKQQFDKSLKQVFGLGLSRREVASEMGMPISTFSSLSSGISFSNFASKHRGNETMDKVGNLNFRLNLHGHSSLTNHFAEIRKGFSVQADRSLKAHFSQNYSVILSEKPEESGDLATISVNLTMPHMEDPIIMQFHSTAQTSIVPERFIGNGKNIKTITKGSKWRRSQTIGSGYKKPRAFEGLVYHAAYFDCEDIRLRSSRPGDFLTKYFQRKDKNLGVNFGRQFSLFRLGSTHMLQSLFLSPQTPTCGLRVSFSRDDDAPSILHSVFASAVARRDHHFTEMKTSGKIAIHTKLNYIGKQPLSILSRTWLFHNQTNLEKTRINSMTTVSGGTYDKKVLCFEIKSDNSPTSDILDYENSNPSYERTMRVNWGPLTPESTSCRLQGPEIIIQEVAERSEDQIKETNSTPALWPYAQCKKEREMTTEGNNKVYPGNQIPVTDSCVRSAFLQTNLQKSQVLISYTIDSDVRSNWETPAKIVKELLSPYRIESESIEEEEMTSTDITNGTITLDLHADEVNPEVDILFNSNTGSREQYRGVDLSHLPSFITRPGYSRLSPLLKDYFDAGVYGYCHVTPYAVQKFDNSSYFTEIGECLTLASADCSAKQSQAYSIQVSKQKRGTNFILKIILDHYTIQLSDLLSFTVNNKTFITSLEGFSPPADPDLFKIVKYDINNLFILSESLGVYVRYNSGGVTIALGSTHKGTQCGLCGNFDGRRENDLSGPNQAVCLQIDCN